MNSKNHRTLTAVAVLALTLASCSVGDEAGPNTSPATSPAAEVLDTDPPATTVTSEPTTADESEIPVSTSSAPVESTTSTTLPAPLKAVQVALDDGSMAQRIDTLGGIATSSDGVRMLMAGSIADGPGTAPRAALRISTDGLEFDDVFLDDALQDGTPSSESNASAIATAGTWTAIAGTLVDADGTPESALWTSADDGITFERMDLASNGASAGTAVLVLDDGFAVLSRVLEDGGPALVVATSDDNGEWRTTKLETDGTTPGVGGMTLLDGQIIVTGSFDVGANRVAASWISQDRGRSFERHIDDTLARTSRIGPPAVIRGEVVALAAQPGNLPTRLVTSTDGITWQPIELSITEFDQDLALSSADVGEVIEWGDGFAIGTTEQLGAVAIVDPEGRGTLRKVPFQQNEIYGRALPFVSAGGLFAAGSSRKSFLVAEYRADIDDWTELGSPGAESARGRVSSGTSLFDLLDGVAAAASTFPRITTTSGGGIRWSEELRWLDRVGATWEPTDRREIDPDTESITSNGTTELATIGVSFDPADDDVAGPVGGTAVAFRTAGGEWSDEELLLTGPGGDYAFDVAATTDGFLLVGARPNRDAAGRSTSTPVLKEYIEGSWIDLPLGVELGDDVALYSVTESAAGVRLATGVFFDGAEYRPFLISPDAAGDWNRIELPGSSPGLTVVDLLGAADTVELVTQEDNDWFLYVSSDGSTFERRPLDFGGDDVTIENAAEIGDRTLLVGTVDVLGVSEVTVWEINDGGGIEAIDLEDPATGVGLFVSDALLDTDTLLIGVVFRQQNLVLEVDIS